MKFQSFGGSLEKKITYLSIVNTAQNDKHFRVIFYGEYFYKIFEYIREVLVIWVQIFQQIIFNSILSAFLLIVGTMVQF